MENVLGIINLANERDLLTEFTTNICPAAVPYGGRYRLIDFVLSNMVNSDIANIALFTHDKYYSLLEHIGTGKEWDLDRNKDGLSVFPPLLSFMLDYKGDVQNYLAYVDYFKKSPQEYVLIAGSTTVCKLDFREVYAMHLKKKADITLLCKKGYPIGKDSILRTVTCNLNGKVTSINNKGEMQDESSVYMQTMLISKALFLELIEKCCSQDKFDLLKDGIIPIVESLNAYVFSFGGYIGAINNLSDYYSHSLKLLNAEVAKELFDKGFPFYTKAKSDPPAKYGADSEVQNTLVTNGCIIEGKIENSILFWGVKVGKKAYIKNSILLPNCSIGKDAKLENIILDREVYVPDGKLLKGINFDLITTQSEM